MQIIADLHTHSIASGHAYSTIREMAAMARKKGLKALAVTDHGPVMPGAPHIYHFSTLRTIPDELEGVRFLGGVEANIIDAEGHLDMAEEILERLDWVTVGIHGEAYAGSNKAENTQALIKAMSISQVDMVTHPCNRQFPVDIEEVVLAAKRYNVVLEINNRSFAPMMRGTRDSREQCLTMARLAQKHKVPIAINSDAHFDAEVGDCEFALQIGKEAGLTQPDILNTDMKRLYQFLKGRKGKVFKRIAV